MILVFSLRQLSEERDHDVNASRSRKIAARSEGRGCAMDGA